VRVGTKLVVAAGLFAMGAFYVWVATASATTSYSTLAAQMVVCGIGMGLTSAPATEALMGVVPRAKAGVGSAVNEATRLLGATLGVAVIGSVYASLYASRLTSALHGGVPASVDHAAHGSVGAAFATAEQLDRAGNPALASAIHDGASAAFFHGFAAANYVAAGVAAAGALLALAFVPAHPNTDPDETAEPRPLGSPAAAPARS
jgi:hypothetical protein